MKKILINASQPEELRIALVEGQQLYDLYIEHIGKEQKKGNIYKGRVAQVKASLEAAFVDYGTERQGFLPLREVAYFLFPHPSEREGGARLPIDSVLHEGQELIVQVEKEERGSKGAGLTTFISLAGRFLVLMPHNPQSGGVSRQITGREREEARQSISALRMPQGMGVILRTAGIGRNQGELQRDLDDLMDQWRSIDEMARERPAPFLLARENDVITRILRDHVREDVREILIDNEEIYEGAHDFLRRAIPDQVGKVKLYRESTPLFMRHQVEQQIGDAFSRELRLPSGGVLIFDHTEALTTVDINSAKSTIGGDIEETALGTNLEAAEEIARQLRLRDLGGLIVIDFIDMVSKRNQQEVENRLREAVRIDRARVQIGRISQFGLLEMSRQRLQPSLSEAHQVTCASCNGTGRVPTLTSQAIVILREIEENMLKETTAGLVAYLPLDIAAFLSNEKRDYLLELERRRGKRILLIPDPAMTISSYRLENLTADKMPSGKMPGYKQLLQAQKPGVEDLWKGWLAGKAPPALEEEDVTKRTRKSGTSLWSWLSGVFARPSVSARRGRGRPRLPARTDRPGRSPDESSRQERTSSRRQAWSRGKDARMQSHAQRSSDSKSADKSRTDNRSSRHRSGRRGSSPRGRSQRASEIVPDGEKR